MKEVTFEINKLAESKGFIPIMSHELYILKDLSSLGLDDIKSVLLMEIQDWLRKKHNIVVSVGRDCDGEYFISNDNAIYGAYETWEEAIEEGLKKELNTIEL